MVYQLFISVCRYIVWKKTAIKSLKKSNICDFETSKWPYYSHNNGAFFTCCFCLDYFFPLYSEKSFWLIC